MSKKPHPAKTPKKPGHLPTLRKAPEIPKPKKKPGPSEIGEIILNLFFRPILKAYTAGLEAGRQERQQNTKPKAKAELFGWLKRQPAARWANLTVYVYRVYPVLKNGPKGVIGRHIEPLSVLLMKKVYGSGVYRLETTENVNGRPRRIRSDQVYILDRRYPPNIHPSIEWADHQGNDAWRWAKPTPQKPPEEAL